MLAMQHELIDRALARAGRGMAYGLAGAYVGAILFIVTIELIDSFLHPQDTKMFWTTQRPV